jgi:hypothetical protein
MDEEQQRRRTLIARLPSRESSNPGDREHSGIVVWASVRECRRMGVNIVVV